MTPTDLVRIDRFDDPALAHVAELVLNRPEALNAVSTAMAEAIRDATNTLAADETVRCVVLTGTGRAFCVGQDLREHTRLQQEHAEVLWRTVPEHYNPIATALATMAKPVVAAVNGVAAGAGAAFAFAADVRLVAESAGFNLAFTGIALSVSGSVPGLTAEQFEEAAQAAKTGCPVSQALSAVPITLEVTFED